MGHAGSAHSCDSSPQTRGRGQNVMAAQSRGHGQGAPGHAPSGTCRGGTAPPPALWGRQPVPMFLGLQLQFSRPRTAGGLDSGPPSSGTTPF